MSLLEIINTACSIGAILVSLYALKYAKRIEIRKGDGELAGELLAKIVGWRHTIHSFNTINSNSSRDKLIADTRSLDVAFALARATWDDEFAKRWLALHASIEVYLGKYVYSRDFNDDRERQLEFRSIRPHLKSLEDYLSAKIQLARR